MKVRESLPGFVSAHHWSHLSTFLFIKHTAAVPRVAQDLERNHAHSARLRGARQVRGCPHLREKIPT